MPAFPASSVGDCMVGNQLMKDPYLAIRRRKIWALEMPPEPPMTDLRKSALDALTPEQKEELGLNYLTDSLGHRIEL